MPTAENTPTPRVGEWYLDLASEEQFEIVDVDDSGDVEVQFLNGEIAEFSRDEWDGRELALIEPPEDWNAPLESIEEGDITYDPEQPVRHRPTAGFEQDEVLLTDEAESRDQVPAGSTPEGEWRGS